MKPAGSEIREQIFETVATMASSLGAPARLKILHVLAQAPRSVEAVAELTGESVANTSQHLQRLRRSGLVCVRKEKVARIYRLTDPAIAVLIEGLFDLAEKVSPSLGQLEARLSSGDGNLVRLSTIRKEIQNNKAILLDVREEMEAHHSPVEGALSVPLQSLKAKAKSLAKGKTYYVICRGRACPLAAEGVRLLRSLGYNAYRLKENPAVIQAQKKVSKEGE